MLLFLFLLEEAKGHRSSVVETKSCSRGTQQIEHPTIELGRILKGLTVEHQEKSTGLALDVL